MKKRIVSIITALALCLSMLPVTALAEGEEETRQPTRTTTLNVTQLTETTDKMTEEGWKWDADTNTLTLNNCYIQTATALVLDIQQDADVTLVLEGDNILETTSTTMNAMITAPKIDSGHSLTIKGDGSLSILRSDTTQTGNNPYGFAGESVVIESGTIYSNVEFCIIYRNFEMKGGSLTIDVANITYGNGIYTNCGNINISGGTVNISAGQCGLYIPGWVPPEDATETINITGGDVTVKSGLAGFYAKNIVIDTAGSLDVQGDTVALYCSNAEENRDGTQKVGGRIEIKKAGSISLTGTYPYLPTQDETTGTMRTVEIAGADYTAVDAAIQKIPEDLTKYTDDSVATLNQAKEAVDRNKTMLEQDVVNGYAKAIEDAFAALVEKVTVTFDSQDGSDVDSQTVNSGGTVTEPDAPTREGYTFGGWYTEADCTTAYDFSAPVTENLTLYAKWTENSPADPVTPPYTPPVKPGYPTITTYPIIVEDASHGAVETDRTRAASGVTVTITVTPDEGYTMDALTATDANGNKLSLTDKGNGKYTFTMPASKVTVEAAFTPVETEPQPCDGGMNCPSRAFTDLDVTAWYHLATDFVIENGLMNGYRNNFFPYSTLTRAELAQILYNREGRPAVSGSSTFADVADNAWYTDAVIWANEHDIVGGYNGLFFPNDPITREQLAAMLWRYAGSPAAAQKKLNFADGDQTSDWALDAMLWATENGIVNGYNGVLNPNGNATRVEAAQMLKNFLENIDQ